MSRKLKLYVWKDVLCDYTCGAMWALATSVEEARAEILKDCDFVPDYDLAEEPEVHEGPIGFALWGGG